MQGVGSEASGLTKKEEPSTKREVVDYFKEEWPLKLEDTRG